MMLLDFPRGKEVWISADTFPHTSFSSFLSCGKKPANHLSDIHDRRVVVESRS
jgi:hypothetical protein